MESEGLQLTVSGEILAFDYSQHDDMVVLASKKCTELFNVGQNGSPSFVLFHEQPHPVKQIKFQKGKGCIFSTVFNGSLTIYDPTKSVCPLIETIKSSFFIVDHDWSRFCTQYLASTTHSDELFLWDTRHITRPTHQIKIGKPCGKVEWCPWNSNLIGVSCDERHLLLWDTRMMRSGGISSSMHIIEPLGGIVHYTWSQKDNNLFTVTGRSQVEQWSVDYAGGGIFDCSDVLISQCVRPTNTTTRLEAGLDGVFLSTNPIYQNSSTADKCPASSATERGSHVSYGTGFKKQSVDKMICFENSKNPTWCDLVVSERVAVVGMSWTPRTEWASTGCVDALLVLSASGILQVLSSAGDTTRHQELSSAGDTTRHQESEKHVVYVLRNARHLQSTPSSELRVSGENLNRRASSAARTSFTSTKSAQSGTHFVRSVITPVQQVVGPLSFLSLLEEELTVLDGAIRNSNGLLEGLRIERLDQFARRVVLEVLIPSIDSSAMRNKVGSIASLNSAGYDGGLGHYYRSEDLHQFIKKGGGSTSSAPQVHSSCTVRSVSLIISFPMKYTAFWLPTFVVDNKANIEVRCYVFKFL
jgi:hypothetical protein